jgi:hypothetical protein
VWLNVHFPSFCLSITPAQSDYIAGLVTIENENEPPPKWEIYIKFLKAVEVVCSAAIDFFFLQSIQSFSGSLNAQRILLQRFFFPPTYEDLVMTKTPQLV